MPVSPPPDFPSTPGGDSSTPPLPASSAPVDRGVVIFDLDGVLIDSEPRWEAAEVEVFGAIGLHLSSADTGSTTGLRVDEVVGHWLTRRPWDDAAPGASAHEVADSIVDAMVDHARTDPIEVPGAADAVARMADAGFTLAVCSSSPSRLIEASLEGLGLADPFEVVHSAEREPAGKPHPACYLSTVERLGVSPHRCVAIEDSVNGAIAAAAAGIAVIAAPPPPQFADPRFAFCPRLLKGLDGLTAELVAGLLS
ncbi:MAG: hexitol phosphatase HxpB [Microthrixaceae bacterium]